MARFEEWLSNQEWKPKVITLCRSAISGYLPSDYNADPVSRQACRRRSALQGDWQLHGRPVHGLAGQPAGAVPAQDGLDRFGLIDDAACRPRHSLPALPMYRQQPAARVSRLPWVPPTPPTSSLRHLTGERCPPGHRCLLSPTHGMVATSR